MVGLLSFGFKPKVVILLAITCRFGFTSVCGDLSAAMAAFLFILGGGLPNAATYDVFGR